MRSTVRKAKDQAMQDISEVPWFPKTSRRRRAAQLRPDGAGAQFSLSTRQRSALPMTTRATFMSLACIGVFALSGACSSDDSDSPSSGGASGTGGASGGASGSGGSTAGSGGSTGGSAGSGGATGGAAGATGGAAGASGGAGGATGGAGGASGGSAGASGGAGGAAVVTLCSCTEAAATDLTAQSSVTITFTCCSYDQPCVKVKAGTKVTWSGSFSFHPLAPFASLGTLPNPTPATTSGSSVEATFSNPGAYGYLCTSHGSEAATGGGMCGAVFVVP